MPAIDGTPTIFDKLRVGFQALTGQAPTNAVDVATLAGVKNDLSKDMAALETLFGATIQAVQGDAFNDVTKFLAGIAAAIPVGSATNLSQVISVVTSAAKALGGPIATQIGQIESSALNTLVSAASVAAGHTKLTAN